MALATPSRKAFGLLAISRKDKMMSKPAQIRSIKSSSGIGFKGFMVSFLPIMKFACKYKMTKRVLALLPEPFFIDNNGPCEIRTRDPLHAKQILSQLS